MSGLELHKAMLSRCETLMCIEVRTQAECNELVAVSSACEAYESVMWPMHDPTDFEKRSFRESQMMQAVAINSKEHLE